MGAVSQLGPVDEVTGARAADSVGKIRQCRSDSELVLDLPAKKWTLRPQLHPLRLLERPDLHGLILVIQNNLRWITNHRAIVF